jgi:hypothetical protein
MKRSPSQIRREHCRVGRASFAGRADARESVVTAAAHKLARLIFTMLTRG